MQCRRCRRRWCGADAHDGGGPCVDDDAIVTSCDGADPSCGATTWDVPDLTGLRCRCALPDVSVDLPAPPTPVLVEALRLGRSLARPETSVHLEQARGFLDRRFAADVHLGDVARAAGYSPHHLHRLFTAAYGETPHDYLTRLRLAEARRLLETTDMSVTDVCLAVGFSSLGSFSSLFRRHVGRPPTSYRRRIHAMRWGGSGPRAIPSCFLARFRAPAEHRKKREEPAGGRS